MDKEKLKPLGYKLRDKKTGLFLRSISRDEWSKTGKTWPRLQDLTRTINIGLKSQRSMATMTSYDNLVDGLGGWEVVELSEENSYSALFILDKLKA
jgi:hypothetical protein